MKTLAELRAEAQQQAEKDNDRHALLQGVAQHTTTSTTAVLQTLRQVAEHLKAHSQELSQAQKTELAQVMAALGEFKQGVRVTNLSELPKTEQSTTINLQGIENINAEVVNVAGLTEALDGFKASLDSLVARNEGVLKEVLTTVKAIKIDTPIVPETKVKVDIPPIKVPEPKVTVNVPKPEVIVTPAPEVPRAKRIIRVEKKRDATGNLKSITEYYDDGTSKTLTGVGTDDLGITYHD